MAVQGAHLTSTVADEGEKPSIFEVLAQESLIKTLKPALQHLLRIFAEKNPARYGRLYVYCDELYLVMHLILEQYYLKHHNSSFAENFYGMKRVVLKGSSKTSDIDENHSREENGKTDISKVASIISKLLHSHRMKSLLFLVFVPYIKHKCDLYYEKLSSDHTRQNEQSTRLGLLKHVIDRLGKVFVAVYPHLHTLWELTMLSYQLRYVFGKSDVHSPFLRWAGVLLQNLTEDDLNQMEPKTSTLDLTSLSWSQRLSVLSSKVLSGLALTLSTGLSVSVFFLQFLEWWYSGDQKAASLTSLPVPTPPQPLTGVTIPNLHTLCPVCQRVRTNDTTLAVSGYVFCYSCISRYVAENQCCPVTKYPATSEHLVRLYLPDS